MWQEFLQPTPKAETKQKSPLVNGGNGFDIPSIELETEAEETEESEGLSLDDAESFAQQVERAKNSGGACSCF